MENILLFSKRYGKKIGICTFFLLAITFFIYQGFMQVEADSSNFQEVAINDIDEEKEEPKEEVKNLDEKVKEQTIFVDVKGAVKKPGVYEVKLGAIINDLVSLAGGFLGNASSDSINLSKKVTDEMVIYVYTKEEIKNYYENKNTNKDEDKNIDDVCKVPDQIICDCTNQKESIIVPDKPSNIINDNNISNDKQDNGLVNINTASFDELITIVGIGEAKAKAIIEYRSSNGDFTTLEDIMNVSGIGDKLFEKIKNYITI